MSEAAVPRVSTVAWHEQLRPRPRHALIFSIGSVSHRISVTQSSPKFVSRQQRFELASERRLKFDAFGYYH